jgi:hypothetical protein
MAISAILVALFFVWFASVRAVPGVRRRKLAWREAWRARERRQPDAP